MRPSTGSPPALLDGPALAVRDLVAGYGGVPVVRGVDLTLSRGECVALTGANGSGKTTLLRCCLGLVPVLGGEVRLCARPVGYVPQRHTVAAVPATVAEVVAAGRLAARGPLARFGRAARRADREAVAEALAAVGLSDRARAGIGELSGGQQRRALVARALAPRPAVVLLDEPTAGVDTRNRELIARALRAAVDRGTAVLVVTHDVPALSGVVHRVVELQAGRLAPAVGDARLPAEVTR
ncbi:metal ABC transporter ATP-binding protein [Kineococcus sp. SYSU DK004]|uniref:metal ABC transporter ATP-binding protein n=1 Tax=Kineococcus sp. SYSU DK004 TaxID=3383125 RepID=UPI003D7CEAA9